MIGRLLLLVLVVGLLVSIGYSLGRRSR